MVDGCSGAGDGFRGVDRAYGVLVSYPTKRGGGGIGDRDP